MEIKYCILNGHLASLYEPFIPFNNRAFHLGDSIFESIRICRDGRIPLIEKHIYRLKLAMSVFKMKIPPEFGVEYFSRLASILYHDNGCSSDVRLRITVFRNGGGNYIPQTNEVSFLMELFPLETPELTLNQEGYWVDVYAEQTKKHSKYSPFKCGSSMFYVMAGTYCASIGIQECLILNEHGNVCESLHSNIFLVKDQFLHTPPAEEGGIHGVMKQYLMEWAAQQKIIVMEKPMTLHHLYEADECFLTNAVQGIRWVYKFRDKFFKKHRTEELFHLLKNKFKPG